MKNLHNVEKSGFRKGEYVGYCDGAWKITVRGDGGWTAVHQQTHAQFSRRTLAEVSEELAERAVNGRGAKLLPLEGTVRRHANGAPMFAPDGMMLDAQGNRSIFDDVDQ